MLDGTYTLQPLDLLSLTTYFRNIQARSLPVDGMANQRLTKPSGEGGPYVVPLNDAGKLSNQALSSLIKLVWVLRSNSIDRPFVSPNVCATILDKSQISLFPSRSSLVSCSTQETSHSSGGSMVGRSCTKAIARSCRAYTQNAAPIKPCELALHPWLLIRVSAPDTCRRWSSPGRTRSS